MVLWVLVLYRRPQCPLRHILDYRRLGIEALDRRPRKSPGCTHKAKVNNPRVRQLGLISCTFRQTNIVWLFYGFFSSQLMFLRFRRDGARLLDPPALTASPGARDLCPNPQPPSPVTREIQTIS